MLSVFTVTGTSPAAATAGTAVVLGSPILGMDKFKDIKVAANLVGATGGTLDVYIQWSPDNGTTWFDYAHFAQLASGASALQACCSSSFGTTVPVVIGGGTAPALAAGACVGGPFGSALRVICAAGTSTTVGAALTLVFYGVRR